MTLAINKNNQYQWEVIVARNIDPPYRYSQEYLWLKVTASNQLQAVDQAQRWAEENNYEATDMVRLFRPHVQHYGHFVDGREAEVFWHLPVVSDMPPGSLLRHPVTGLRLGYLAWPSDEENFIGDLHSQQYRIVSKKPSAGSLYLGLAPIVSSLQYSFAARR
jgi:hypothetical protein